MAKRTPSERIERAHMGIMRHPTFCVWSGLLFVGTWKIVPGLPTARVFMNGNTEYGKEFVEALPLENNQDVFLNWVILHEKGHMAMMHMTRHKKLWVLNPELANVAADFIVNLALYDADPQETFAKHPRNPDGTMKYLFDEKYRGWSLMEVFNDLVQQQQQQGGGKGGKGGSGPKVTYTNKGFDEHANEGDDGQMSEEEQKRIEREIDQALRTGQYMASKMQGNANRLLGDILDPQVDWKEELAQFIQEVSQGDDDATWRRPNRRFVGMDMYLPSLYSETCGEIVCAIDTSGSVSQAECTACVSEVVAVARVVRPTKLRLIYWDDGVESEEVYTPDQYDGIVAATMPKGGGGTVIEPVAKYVNGLKDVQCAIILTDGGIYGSWGTWNVPVLWCFTHKGVTAPCGRGLYIDV